MDTARESTENLAALLRREHEALTDFLVALADFDARRIWGELGHTSLFWFLHRELGLSKGAAFYRKTAAELVQRFPEVVEPLRDGRLCLSSVAALAKVLTPENRDTVIPRFFHRSKSEAMEVVAELKPVEAPPRRSVVTVVRAAAPAVVAVPAASAAPDVRAQEQIACAAPVGFPENLVDAKSPCAEAHAPTSPVERERVEPLDAELRRLHLTVPRRLLEKIAAARDALSHSRPDATTDEILETALDLLLARAAKAKGLVDRPLKNPRPSNDEDHIPAHVKREVMKRDGGRCQFRLASSEICGCTRYLQFDHIEPRALGGLSTVANLRLRCRAHNIVEARRVFGGADGPLHRPEAEAAPSSFLSRRWDGAPSATIGQHRSDGRDAAPARRRSSDPPLRCVFWSADPHDR
jgi:hypothetical protein